MRLKSAFAAFWLWEFLQNLPPALGFFYGYAVLGDNMLRGLAFSAAGGLLGALVIRFTEGFIEAGAIESWANTILNAVFFATGSMLMLLYFDNHWGGWLIDAAIGATAGILLSVSQAKAAGKSLHFPHLAAMLLALGAALPCTRLLLLYLQPLPAALGLCLAVSWLIVFVEYRSNDASGRQDQ